MREKRLPGRLVEWRGQGHGCLLPGGLCFGGDRNKFWFHLKMGVGDAYGTWVVVQSPKSKRHRALGLSASGTLEWQKPDWGWAWEWAE